MFDMLLSRRLSGNHAKLRTVGRRVCMSKNRSEEGAKLINALQCLNEPKRVSAGKSVCVHIKVLFSDALIINRRPSEVVASHTISSTHDLIRSPGNCVSRQSTNELTQKSAIS